MWCMFMKSKINSIICLNICLAMMCICVSSCGNMKDNIVIKKIESLSKMKDKETSKDETEQYVTTDGGGDEGKNISTIKTYEIDITVSGNDYLLGDECVTIEEIIGGIVGVDGEVSVTITDKEASYNAYKRLIKELDENQIEYSEQ